MYGHTNPTIRTTSEGEQVGPKMHSALKLLNRNGPYPNMNQLATTVGPNGSSQFGYRIIKRCKHKGLLTVDDEHEQATPGSRGAVVLTEKGERYLENADD
jgi:hypothetical protein